MSIREDHIHIINRINPTDTLADVIQRLKGVTSRLLRKEFPEQEEFLRGDSFAGDRYFSERVGKMDEEVVRR